MCASRRSNTSNAACGLRVGGLLERRKSHRVIELVNKLTRELERVPHPHCVSETRRICGAADLTWCCVCWRCDLAVWRCLPSVARLLQTVGIGRWARRPAFVDLPRLGDRTLSLRSHETTPFRSESHRIAFFALISFTSSACCR